jgi:hypothetical protein
VSGRVFGYTFGRVPTWLLEAEVSDRAVRLFALLTRYADQEGRGFPGRRTLAERLRCSVDSIDRALRELVGAGAVRIEERWDVDGDGGRLTNDYHLLEHQHQDPGRSSAAPPSRMGAAPPAAPVRPQREREPGERESDPDGEDHPERPKSPAAASLGGGPLGVGRTCPPTSPPRGGWVDPSVLIAAIDEAAQSVGETAVPRTAAALYGIALRESRARPMGDRLRAMAAAYARGTAEAVDEAQVRSHRPGCAPLRDLPALAFHIARRQLTGEGPPPWPERRPQPSRSMPPATEPPCWSPSREGAGHVGPELLPAARPEREVTAAVTTSTAWDDLDAAQRARAEALVRQEQPELTRLTGAQGAIWRQAVIAAAAQTTEEVTPSKADAPVPAREKTS